MKTPHLPWKWIIPIVLVSIIIADAFVQKHMDIVLQGFFCNDENNYFPASNMEKAYEAYLGLGKWQRVHFEDDLFVEIGSKKDYTTASASKIVAYAAAKELDFLVVPEHLVSHYANAFTLVDLSTLTSQKLSLFLSGTDRKPRCLLDLGESRYLKGKTTTESYFLMVPETSRRKEAVRQFLTYVFSEDMKRSLPNR